MPEVSTRVYARSAFGQFASKMSQAATETVEEAIEDGADLSRQLAPVGQKFDPRGPALKDSIETKMLTSTSGHWFSTARHALPIELGAGPHLLPGDVAFFWDTEGRWWKPGDNLINHPGNAAQPFLRPAFDMVMRRAMSIAKKHYGG